MLAPARALQAAFERGEVQENLLSALSVFGSYRPELTDAIVRNAETRSNDYVSQLAAGGHYLGLLGLLRTMRLGRDIPQESRARMVTATEQADIYLRRALHTTSQPSLAYALRLNSAMVFGQDTWDVYIEGLRRCPTSLRLREEMLKSLRAEWGGNGDFSAMRAFLRRPEHQSLPEDQQRRLAALELAYEAHHHLHFLNDAARGFSLYRQSIALTPTISAYLGMMEAPSNDPTNPLANVDTYAQLVLDMDPDNDHARARWGAAHALSGRSWYGLKVLRHARMWGETYAADQLRQPGFRRYTLFRVLARLGQ
ncbi:hypothetical protein MF271_23250 (plasmid) [Deinococcus sp. KNUC1210]|uniref:hypothetical protein n=1 Tax=Deinococcus sp. KNUC1210 TaxID=2917691 RepID=UPI001EF0E67E|nr:hypothetical protein [Deinococcus sp. KNUC1210]ULH17894.1 hypothetical protein MF271_23250 [Deinococcus sp. KNUC1210]